MRRRTFLAGAVASVAGAACGDPESLERRVRRVRRVVRAYFDGVGRSELEEIAGVVAQALGDDPRWIEGPLAIIEAAGGKAEAIEALGQAIRAEFRRTELVAVHGWMLAPTEAGLVALLA